MLSIIKKGGYCYNKSPTPWDFCLSV